MVRLLRTYLRPYARPIGLVVALLAVQAIGTLYLPSLNADIINNGVAKGDIPYILRIGGLMLVVSLVLGIASIIAVYWSSKTAMAFGRDVRRSIFRKVLSFSQTETNTFGAPSLITRNTNDVQQVQMLLVMGLNVMILAPIMAVGGVIMCLREDVALSAILLVIVPLMAIFLAVMLSRALPLFRAMQVKVDRINQVVRETLSGVRVIRAFVRTRHEEERFDEANLDLFATTLRVNRLFALMIPTVMAIFNLSTVAIMWFGSIAVDNGTLAIGNLTAFLAYVMQILFSVMMAVIMFVMVPRAAASSERIQQVLDTEVAIHDPETPVADRRRPRPGRVPRRLLRVPGRRGRGPASDLVRGRPRRDDRHRGQHRQRQVDPDQPHPALLRRDRGRGVQSTASTSARCARRTSGA